MRVLLFVTDLEPGGTPLRIARLARGLRELGVEVTVGCLAPLGAVGRILAAEGFATLSLNVTRPWRLDAIFRLIRHLRNHRYDLIHATLTHANVVARLAGYWTRTPVVTSTATVEVERRWHRWVERCTANWDRGHIVNSRALAAHITNAFKVPSDRVHVVAPSVQTLSPTPRGVARQKLGLSDEDFVVAAIGRLDPVKRFDWLIRAIARTSSPRMSLALAGEGKDRERLERLARELGVIERVRFLGWLDDPALLYCAADIVACVSRTEGTPNVVLEALSLNRLVLATPLPVIREWVGAGAAIRLMERDDETALCDALRAAAQTPPGSGAKPAARLDFFDRDAAKETIAVYQRVLT